MCGDQFSFHRPHRASTYTKWAESTSPEFRFAVKVPRTITHDQKLRGARVPFAQFLEETDGLGCRRGPLLVQLPPSFAFEARLTAGFFDMVRSHYDGLAVCEPRHPTWFGARADDLLRRYAIARVVADPAPAPAAVLPGGWTESHTSVCTARHKRVLVTL